MYAITGPEAVAALRRALGDEAGWYLDSVAARWTPQQANGLVEDLTGVPAPSVAQWAGQNAALFDE